MMNYSNDFGPAGHKVTANHESMPNGEDRYRLKKEDETGYIRTVMGNDGAWQEAHYHKWLRETYIVQKGWIGYAESLNGEMVLSVYKAGQSFTTAPNVTHNVFMPKHSEIHTVKHGCRPPGKDKQKDRTEGRATRRFTEKTKLVSVKQLEALHKVPVPARFLVLVERRGGGIAPIGLLPQEVAHRPGFCATPHASVLIVPYYFAPGSSSDPRILVHRRPGGKRVCPGALDAFGGHVRVSGPDELFSRASPNDRCRLNEIIEDTVVREAREELDIDNVKWEARHFRRFKDYGAFDFGLSGPGSDNAEYSTLFVVRVPPRADAIRVRETTDEDKRKFLTGLKAEFRPLSRLILDFGTPRGNYADGLRRLLSRISESRKNKEEFVQFLSSGREAA